MAHAIHAQLLARVRAALADGDRAALAAGSEREIRIPVEHYQSAARFAAERRLFRRVPIVVGHASEVAEPGRCFTNDDTGVSVIVARGQDGELRGFLNACRHRGTRLLDAAEACRRKALVCPYHGWTYDLDGRLRHVPHAEAFPTLDPGQAGLVEVPVSLRHGFVWLTATPGAVHDVDGYLGSLGDELATLGIENHVLFRRSVAERHANWKLLVEAFMENYHLRCLHRDTVYRFFLDAVGVLDRVGIHMRAATARRPAADAAVTDAGADLRSLITITYHVFPSTLVLLHPDYVSRMSILPLAVDRLRWVHDMLVPAERATETDREHWERSFELIEGGVFQREDLAIAERMQAGLETGANSALTFGRLEGGIGWFHEELAARLAE